MEPAAHPAEAAPHDLVRKTPQMLPLTESPRLTVLGHGAVGDAMLMQENDSVGETAPELAVLLRPAAANSPSTASA